MQETPLSRWRHGFEPRWDYAGQRLCRHTRDLVDPKTARHAGQCEFNGVTDPAMLRVVLRVTPKDGYDWVECNACDIGWQVPYFAESVG
jgi:hypothetical protein